MSTPRVQAVVKSDDSEVLLQEAGPGRSNMSLTAAGSLTMLRYNNTALAGMGARSSLETLNFSMPGEGLFSVEVSGTLSPLAAATTVNSTWWSFNCTVCVKMSIRTPCV